MPILNWHKNEESYISYPQKVPPFVTSIQLQRRQSGSSEERYTVSYQKGSLYLNAGDSNQSCFSRDLLDFVAFVVVVVENNGRRTSSVNLL